MVAAVQRSALRCSHRGCKARLALKVPDRYWREAGEAQWTETSPGSDDWRCPSHEFVETWARSVTKPDGRLTRPSNGWHDFSDPDGTVWLPGAKYRAERGRAVEVVDPEDYVGTYDTARVVAYVEARTWRWFRYDGDWSGEWRARRTYALQPLDVQPTHVACYQPSSMAPWGVKKPVYIPRGAAFAHDRESWEFRNLSADYGWQPRLKWSDGRWRDRRYGGRRDEARVVMLKIRY